MRKLILAAVFILGLGGAAFAEEAPEVSLTDIPSGAYVMDNTHASLNWKLSHFGLSRYTARFTRFTVDLNFDAKAPQNSTLSASIDPTSIRTDFPNPEKEDFDQTLAKGAQWFNADKFPAITYRATGITRTGKNTGTISGNLTMLGKTLPVSMDVTLNGAYAKHPMAGDPAIGFSGHGTLKRSDWGLATFVPMVGDEVEFFIEAEFHKAP